MLTKDSELSKAGECIIGVNADKACFDLPENLKAKLKTNSKFEIILRAGNLEEKITGFGSPELKLTSKKDLVLRKSSYIDDRTLLIKCNKVCKDLDRKFVEKLKNPEQELEILMR